MTFLTLGTMVGVETRGKKRTMYQPAVETTISSSSGERARSIGTDEVRTPAVDGERLAGLREVLEGKLPDLAPCARLLAGDAEPEILDRAVARAVATWRGPVGPELCAYVLCWFVYLRRPRQAHVGLVADDCPHGAVLFATLPPTEQLAIVLAGYAELPAHRIAAVAGRVLAEIELESAVPMIGPVRPIAEAR
ncbi:hypothetical protein ACFWDA_13430 [Rhodococcus zopfii]|uniref:hypothetical protein n=1 Tax=Rhodococcus zopfii TaxID=43772 RepID=UPI001F10A77C|nr:hypothetical protein [Rhodococcus zopfii]